MATSHEILLDLILLQCAVVDPDLVNKTLKPAGPFVFETPDLAAGPARNFFSKLNGRLLHAVEIGAIHKYFIPIPVRVLDLVVRQASRSPLNVPLVNQPIVHDARGNTTGQEYRADRKIRKKCKHRIHQDVFPTSRDPGSR